jgi:hypothetical protein
MVSLKVIAWGKPFVLLYSYPADIETVDSH